MATEFVFLLWHTHLDDDLDNGEDIKLIGVYSSESKAKEALSRSIKLEGFRDYKEGFEISAHKLDKDEWASGFVIEKD